VNFSDAGMRFNLHHVQTVEDGGAVYDFSNLRIVSPRTHATIHGTPPEKEAEVIRKLTREQLVEVVEDVLDPERRRLTSEEVNRQLILFCLNCPDPVAAMGLIVEGGPETAEGIVAEALNRPPQDPRSLPTLQLHPDHPLRHSRWVWEES
jgi:hypothetical protein